jgi:hypothetical protein
LKCLIRRRQQRAQLTRFRRLGKLLEQPGADRQYVRSGVAQIGPDALDVL